MFFLFGHLFPKLLEPVGQLRATVAAVCEFADKERERLRVSIRSLPASTGSKPASWISLAATFLALWSSPQYTRLGRVSLPLDSNTPNSTSLGTVLKARTTWARGTFFTSSSAP